MMFLFMVYKLWNNESNTFRLSFFILIKIENILWYLQIK